MKPAPKLPGRTPWERLDIAFRTVLTVSKQALLKKEAKQWRQKKRAKKQT